LVIFSRLAANRAVSTPCLRKDAQFRNVMTRRLFFPGFLYFSRFSTFNVIRSSPLYNIDININRNCVGFQGLGTRIRRFGRLGIFKEIQGDLGRSREIY
jgi:hypothetical protein